MTCPVCKGNPRGVSAGFCKQIGRTIYVPCEACDYDGNVRLECPTCNGDPDYYASLHNDDVCPTCKGTGKREND